jgi:hypothetical protein
MRGLKNVLQNMEEEEKRMKAAGMMIAKYIAEEMERYAKENAIWTDRTSNARQGLKGTTRFDENAIYAVIAHSVEYGKWLEIAHEKKYAILKQTVNKHYDDFVRAIEKVADGEFVGKSLNTNFFS